MIRTIDIVLQDNPSNLDSFQIDLNVMSEFFHITPTYIFKTVQTDPYDVPIGINVSATAINLVGQLENTILLASPFPSGYITIVQNADGATIIIDAYEVESSTISITGDIDITHSSEVGPDEVLILSRSPYFVSIVPSFTFDKAIMNLRIWQGHKTIDRPALATYTMSKNVIVAGQPQIIFNVAKIVNDFVKGKYNGLGSAGAYTTSLLDNVWIESDIAAYFDGDNVATGERLYLAVDGFGYHTQGANPVVSEKVLCSINNHVVYPDTNYPLAFITQGLVSITINGVGVPFTFNQDYSNQVIGYVNLKSHIGSSSAFTAIFNYGEAGVFTHTVTVQNECMYDIINCIFKNKFGYWQAIAMPKMSREKQDFTRQNYNAIALSASGAYALNTHVKKAFGINGIDKITCNTDFLPEDYNEAFTEMFLSEFVYLEEAGVARPVNVVTDSFSKKTKLVNKLIQYTLDFEYSNSIINNIN